MSLFLEELDRHPELLPRCIERDPEAAIFSFLEERREQFEARLKATQRDYINGVKTLCIDGQQIHLFVDAWINPLVDGL